MAINKNHEFEELDGIKCGIVEKNVSASRADFLRAILENNGYAVIVVPSPPPKPATGADEVTEKLPETFTIGVTDYTFNAINAIFGRLLKTAQGQVVTLAYWQQKVSVNDEEKPYFE
ncbi:MAG: hypothetical protein NTZ41_00485 [Sphingobacteriales bacterium]|nr:hypothetical protein [Sphingobacteriales bacterium]